MDESWPSTAPTSPGAPPPRRENPLMRVLGSLGFVLDAFRRRRAGRISLWALVLALTLGGTGLLAYPLATSVWAGQIQQNLEERFTELEKAGGDPTGFQEKLVEGDALTRIKIPKLRVNAIVVQGVGSAALRAGVGHFPHSALPGDPTGNVVIAGHRTGFKGFFRHLNTMKPGDRIELSTPYGVYTYSTVSPFDGHANPWVIEPTDFSVTNLTPEPSLTLITCDPPGSNKHRLVLRARLVGTQNKA